MDRLYGSQKETAAMTDQDILQKPLPEEEYTLTPRRQQCPKCGILLMTVGRETMPGKETMYQEKHGNQKDITTNLIQESVRIITEVITTGGFTLSDGTIREVSDAQILSLCKKFVDKQDAQGAEEDTGQHIPTDLGDVFGL